MEDNRKMPRSRLRRCLRTNLKVAATLLSVLLGVCVGMIMKKYIVSNDVRSILSALPEIFSDFLQLVTVPLILTNVIIRISKANICSSKNVTSNALVYFFLTTLFALLTGSLLVQLIKPGVNYNSTVFETFDDDDDPVDAVFDLIMNVVPTSVFQPTFQHDRTQYLVMKAEADNNDSNLTVEKKEVVQSYNGINIVGLTVLAIFTGKALRMRERGQGGVLMRFINTFNLMAKHVVGGILHYLPVEVLLLIAIAVNETEDNWETALCLTKFFGAVMIGLIIHGVVVLPLFLLLTRKNPYPVLRGVFPALKSTLIGSRSHAASQMYKCCDEVLSIDRRITGFMLPIGMNVNMNGTALYEMAAAIFVMQLSGIPLTWYKLFTLGVTVAVFTVGKAGIPATGAVTTLSILSVSEVPLVNASFLLVTHWLINRCNTVVNILGDCVGVALVEHLSTGEPGKNE